MNRRSSYDNIKTAAWMALLSAVLAFVVVSVGEASARNGRATKLVSPPAAASAAIVSAEMASGAARAVRVVYPAVVVAR